MNAGISVRNSTHQCKSDFDSAEDSRTNESRRTPLDFPSLAELEAAEERATKDIHGKTSLGRKRSTGLEDALNLIRGEKTSSVLNNTRQSWQKFKCRDGVRDELDDYKKDKNRFTDRMAFLERSDMKEWKYEQQGRKSRR